MKKPIELSEINELHEEWRQRKAQMPTKKLDVVTRTFTIVSVRGEERTSDKGNNYTVMIIEYRNNKDGELKNKTVPIFTDEGQMILKTVEEGASYTVTLKRDGKYWRWLRLYKYADG